MIDVVQPESAKLLLQLSLGMPSDMKVEDEALIAQVVRRASHALAPVRQHVLVRLIEKALSPLFSSSFALSDQIAVTVEELIAYGELLDQEILGDVDGFSESETLLRPAPPSFVTREDGAIVLLGTGGDVVTPLPPELESKLQFHGTLRLLVCTDVDAAASLLRDEGLLELREKTWLRLPSAETVDQHIDRWKRDLAVQPPSGVIDGIAIQHGSKLFGRVRPLHPSDHGLMVARRPQKYGAARWCFVEVDQGILVRFLDIRSQDHRHRPCDLAWRLKAALDHAAGQPQKVAVESVASSVMLSFFDPLPSWAERRLLIRGAKEKSGKGLYTFVLPSASYQSEMQFLKDALWMRDLDERASA
jgi:hypothetical protein